MLSETMSFWESRMGFGFFFLSFLFNKSPAVRGRQKERERETPILCSSKLVVVPVWQIVNECRCVLPSPPPPPAEMGDMANAVASVEEMMQRRKCKREREKEREMAAIEKLAAADRPLNSLFPKQQSVCLGVSKPVLSTVLFSSSAALPNCSSTDTWHCCWAVHQQQHQKQMPSYFADDLCTLCAISLFPLSIHLILLAVAPIEGAATVVLCCVFIFFGVTFVRWRIYVCLGVLVIGGSA